MAWGGGGAGGGAGGAAGGNGTHAGGNGTWAGAGGAANATRGGSGGGGGWGGGGGSSGGRPAYLLAMFARREKTNHDALDYLAAGFAGVLAIFVFFHWTRVLVNRHLRRAKAPAVIPGSLAPFTTLSRLIRNGLIRKFPGLPSGGHLLLILAYVAINLSVAFTNIVSDSQTTYASRFGYMTAGNLFLVVFLSLKNTPLAFLTAYSYERINILHRIAGYSTFVWLILHAAMYSSYFIETDKINIMQEHEQTAGIIAGFAMLTTVFAGTVLRRLWYEVFLVVHILCYIAIIVGLGFHRPDLGDAIAVITILAGCIWALDRLTRYLRLAFNAVNNTATVYPLPNGGTKVVMRKPPRRAVPGKHAFVWIPRLRAFEMHPFSIVSTDPCEFIVCARDGFTRALHKYATENPGASLRASVDGCYGTFPDPMEYDKIILIAGGSGASFTIGLAVNILQRMTETSTQSIVFIWAVKEHEYLSWFTDHLETLRNHPNAPKCNVALHVTRGTSRTALGEMAERQPRRRVPTAGSLSSGYGESQTPMDGEKEHVGALPNIAGKSKEAGAAPADKPTIPRLPSLPAMTTQLSSDPEKHGVEHAELADAASPASSTASTASTSSAASLATPGRPDTASVIRREVANTPADKRILVAACGPSGLMHVVRNTTAAQIRGDGPAVELHCEQFGW